MSAAMPGGALSAATIGISSREAAEIQAILLAAARYDDGAGYLVRAHEADPFHLTRLLVVADTEEHDETRLRRLPLDANARAP